MTEPIFWGKNYVEFRFKGVYSFSHNHGSVENGCVWKVSKIGDTPIFRWAMIMVGWQHNESAQAEVESSESNMTWKPPEVEACFADRHILQAASSSLSPEVGRAIWAIKTFLLN